MQKQKKIAFWYQLGPIFLTASLCVTLFKAFSSDALLIILGLLGIIGIRKWQKRGLVASILALAFACVLHPTLLFILFSASIALSLALTWMGSQEVEQLLDAEGESKVFLERELVLEQEKAQKMLDQVARLNEEITQNASREKAFQTALESAQNELAKYREKQALQAEHHNIIEQEEAEEEKKEWKQRYALLHHRFLERSDAVDRAREELFLMETQFLALQKECQEKEVEQLEQEFAILSHLQEMQEEAKELQGQLHTLQDCLSHLLLEKKIARAPRKKKTEEDSLFISLLGESGSPPPLL